MCMLELKVNLGYHSSRAIIVIILLHLFIHFAYIDSCTPHGVYGGERTPLTGALGLVSSAQLS